VGLPALSFLPQGERMMGLANIRKIVEELMVPLEAQGFELWNVEYGKDGKDLQLRVFADKAGGISLDDCEAVSRLLSARLDEDDPIKEPYSLVVSSPGMDRPLLKEEHFARYAGEPVEVSLYKSYGGLKKFTAILVEKTAESLTAAPIDRFSLQPIGDALTIPSELVSKVNLLVVF
jgi:ribosome maturation factor RimP